MTVEVRHVREVIDTIVDHTHEPADNEEILAEAEYHGETLYKVAKETIVQDEQYIVYTSDAQSSKTHTYYVEQNDEGEWEVVKRVMKWAKYNQTRNKTPKSTDAVREALPVDVVN